MSGSLSKILTILAIQISLSGNYPLCKVGSRIYKAIRVLKKGKQAK